MRKLAVFLAILSVGLGATQPCWGLYVMVRSGFGKLRGKNISMQEKRVPVRVNYDGHAEMYRTSNKRCSTGAFSYKDYNNLSVALGVGIESAYLRGVLDAELEFLGGVAEKKGSRNKVQGPFYGLSAFEAFDFFYFKYLKPLPGNTNRAKLKGLYLQNQRIAGLQINLYWTQALLDRLSVGIGGGLGGAYVCTKFTTLEWMWNQVGGAGGTFNILGSGHKYVHTGAFLWNFTSFVRYEAFGVLFEGGYRHISLHQMIDNRVYRDFKIKKLADLQSDQVYFGIGKRF